MTDRRTTSDEDEGERQGNGDSAGEGWKRDFDRLSEVVHAEIKPGATREQVTQFLDRLGWGHSYDEFEGALRSRPAGKGQYLSIRRDVDPWWKGFLKYPEAWQIVIRMGEDDKVEHVLVRKVFTGP